MGKAESTGTVERHGNPAHPPTHAHTLKNTGRTEHEHRCMACSDTGDGSHVRLDGVHLCSRLCEHQIIRVIKEFEALQEEAKVNFNCDSRNLLWGVTGKFLKSYLNPLKIKVSNINFIYFDKVKDHRPVSKLTRENKTHFLRPLTDTRKTLVGFPCEITGYGYQKIGQGRVAVKKCMQLCEQGEEKIEKEHKKKSVLIMTHNNNTDITSKCITLCWTFIKSTYHHLLHLLFYLLVGLCVRMWGYSELYNI